MSSPKLPSNAQLKMLRAIEKDGKMPMANKSYGSVRNALHRRGLLEITTNQITDAGRKALAESTE